MTPRLGAAVALGVGLAVVLAAAVSGSVADVIAAIATPPALVRAALVAGSAVLGAYLLVLALRRIEEARLVGAGAPVTTAQLATMVRGIRFVFLAAAAFAAAAGWLAGQPLPIVIGLVIAGVDLAETSFLLLVATSRGR
ncbi:MAG TPA: hypothetical protein VGI98_05930 [Candidatus Limnocylindrales bacterium]